MGEGECLVTVACTLIVCAALCLGIAVPIHSVQQMQYELEMAKLGYVQQTSPANVNKTVWVKVEEPIKDES